MAKIKIITAIIMMIVGIIVIFSIIGGMSSSIKEGAESITDANNCSLGKDANSAELEYNITNKYCYNTTGNVTARGNVYLAGQYDLPLNSLYGSSGVVILILMAVLLISAVMFGWQVIKRK